MIPSDGNETSSAELRALRAEIKDWAFGIRCVFTVLNVLPLYYCTRILLASPRFESIFEDMLGSKDKLPGLTRLLLEWSMPLLACVWLLAALTIVLIFTLKQARHVWITAAVSAFVLIATGHLVATVFIDPLITVIQNLSGG
jgi:type II secretory pathway component PulF